jgi:competence protein ComEC
LSYRAVDSRTGIIDVHDPAVALHVLGPRLVNIPGEAAPVYPWLGSAVRTVNGHSVILRLDFGNVRVLFPGDVNRRGARHLMEDPSVGVTSSISEFALALILIQ